MTMHSYLRIDGVPGSSTDVGYEGWIGCDSVSWLLRGAGAAGGASEIRFVKARDATSPVLERLCVGATRLPAARFDFVRVASGGTPTRSYEIALEDVVVALVATGPSREAATMETVVLTFANARLTPVGADGPPETGHGSHE